jgi:hypothetical protein
VTGDRFKTIAIVLVAIVVAFLGFRLAQYSEADDAPGGVVIAGVMMLGAVVLVVKTLRRKQ